MQAKNLHRVLISFKTIQQYLDFAIGELKCLLDVSDEKLKMIVEPEFRNQGVPVPDNVLDIRTSSLECYPFMEIQLENLEDVDRIMKRAVMIKHIFLLLGKGSNYDELFADISQNELFKLEQQSTETLAFQVSGSGKSIKYSKFVEPQER